MKTITVDEYRAMKKPGPRRGIPRPGWEAEFADYLERARLAGDIVSWAYEPLSIILVHGRQGTRGERYEPDFVAIDKYQQTFVYEIKRPNGKGRQLGINKLKAAAEKFSPWTFYLVEKVRGVWKFKAY